MPDLTILQRAVADVSRQIRVRRAEFYGLRGLFGGSLAALLPLVLRDSLGWSGFLWAGGCLAVGAVVGLAAAVFAAYLVVVQVAVIHAICVWCVASDTITVTIAVLAVFRLTRTLE